MYLLVVFIAIINCVLSHEEIIRPDGMNNYLALRSQCEWKEMVKTDAHKCPGEAVECTLNVTLPEGKGYLKVVRFGPFTTTGGFQAYKCEDPAHVPPTGSYAIREVIGPIDPYTETFLEYPPIHLHHAMVRPTKVDLPENIPPDVMWQLPFLSLEEFQTQVSVFAANGIHCTSKEGGSKCYHVQTPDGYGQYKYDQSSLNSYTFFNQDVRALNSPPISTVMEFGEIYITEPTKPIKATSDGALTVGARDPPYTFAVPYGKPSYIFATYYFSMKVEFRGARMHFHPLDGDEVWIIRGTQDDVGIPKEIQTGPAFRSKTAGPVDKSHELDEGVTMEEFKQSIEDKVTKAGNVFEYKKENYPNLVQKAPLKYGYFQPFNQNNPQPSVSKPEILCKYYGETEYLDPTLIKAKGDLLRTKIAAAGEATVVGKHHREALATSDVESSDVEAHRQTSEIPGGALSSGLKPKPTNHRPAEPGINTVHEQMNNLYAGTLPGNYYRIFQNSQTRGEENYQQCNSFDVEAGDYITIVMFNAPRVQPPDEEYDFTQLTMMQHMILSAQVHMPDTPFFNPQ